jgi:hypothetical protein
VLALAVTGEGLVVSGDRDGAVRLSDAGTPGRPSREVARDDRGICTLARTADGRLLVATPDGITLFELNIGEMRSTR